MVRHGQRGDDFSLRNQVIRNKQDVHLTDKGHRQATETGQFLKKYLGEIA